ncbi:MAG: DUF99 family protein [Methanothrix sp.]|nr:DUF99 family protein [Methanothrix sp.]
MGSPLPLHLNKSGLRVLGIAESFVRSRPVSTIAGVIMRADLRVDGLAYAHATVGGDDAALAIMGLCRQLDRADVNALILSGAALSWFNIVDLKMVFEETEKPLICLTYGDSPGLEEHIRQHFPCPDEKLRIYRSLGERQKINLKTGYEVFVRVWGAATDEARILLNKFTRDGRVPEPVRLARLAARANLERCSDEKAHHFKIG